MSELQRGPRQSMAHQLEDKNPSIEELLEGVEPVGDRTPESAPTHDARDEGGHVADR